MDDDPDLARVLVDTLAFHDFSCESVASGEEAVAKLATSPLPDLILLDIMLPGISGFQVLKRLKDEPSWRAIRVVMISTLTDKATLKSAGAGGAADYIQKPFEPMDVIERVRKALSTGNGEGR